MHPYCKHERHLEGAVSGCDTCQVSAQAKRSEALLLAIPGFLRTETLGSQRLRKKKKGLTRTSVLFPETVSVATDWRCGMALTGKVKGKRLGAATDTTNPT